MFFKKKKEELSDQLATYQVRSSPRWGTPFTDLKAGISIEGFEGEGQLGNVSVTGCSLLSITYVNIKPDEVYRVKIIPCKTDRIEPFTLKMKLNWTKSNETLFYAGFSVDKDEDDSQLRGYVSLLRSHGIEPDYGNMSPVIKQE